MRERERERETDREREKLENVLDTTCIYFFLTLFQHISFLLEIVSVVESVEEKRERRLQN